MTKPPLLTLRDALEDLLSATEEYFFVASRPSVNIVVVRDEQTGDALLARGLELSAAQRHAQDVLEELAALLEEEERTTTPVLPDARDDASEEARASNAKQSDDEVRDRASGFMSRVRTPESREEEDDGEPDA